MRRKSLVLLVGECPLLLKACCLDLHWVIRVVPLRVVLVRYFGMVIPSIVSYISVYLRTFVFEIWSLGDNPNMDRSIAYCILPILLTILLVRVVFPYLKLVFQNAKAVCVNPILRCSYHIWLFVLMSILWLRYLYEAIVFEFQQYRHFRWKWNLSFFAFWRNLYEVSTPHKAFTVFLWHTIQSSSKIIPSTNL